MAIDSNGYVETPLSTEVSSATNTTERAEYSSLELYNNSEIEVLSVARGRTPLLSTLFNIGKGMSGGQFNTLNIASGSTINFPEFKWKEKDQLNDLYTVDGTINSSATTLELDSTAGLFKGHILRDVTTNEHIRITSVTDSTTVVIQRGVGTTSAAQITDNDVLQVIGVASTRGVATVGTVGVAASDKSNYIQKFLTTFTETDFDKFTPKASGSQVLVAENTIQHALELEKAALFGEAKSSTDPVTGEPYYTMQGVLQYAKNGWSDDLSSALTRVNIEEAFSKPLKYTKDGSYTKIVLCGSKARSAIAELFENRINVTSIKETDLTFNSIQMNQGKFMFLDHPFLDSDSGFDGYAIVLDPSYIKVLFPTGKGQIDNASISGKTKLNIVQNESNDAITTASLTTFLTLQLANPNSAGIFRIV